MLDSFRNGFCFCLKAEKSFQSNFYCLPFTLFMVCIHEHRNQLERQCPGTGLTQPLTALEMQLRRASEQGKLLCVCVGSLDERLHVQQLNGRSVFYIYLYDIFGLYPLMEIYIVFDRLFFQLNVLLTVCSPLNAFFILVGRHKYLRETTL